MIGKLVHIQQSDSHTPRRGKWLPTQSSGDRVLYMAPSQHPLELRMKRFLAKMWQEYLSWTPDPTPSSCLPWLSMTLQSSSCCSTVGSANSFIRSSLIRERWTFTIRRTAEGKKREKESAFKYCSIDIDSSSAGTTKTR